MIARNIRSVCRKKIDQICDSLPAGELQVLFRANAIITGGAIASMLLGEPVNDFDIYFRTRDATLLFARHYVRRFLEAKTLKNKNGEPIDMYVDESDANRIKVMIRSAGVASESSADSYQYFEQVDPNGGEAADYVEDAMAVAELKKEQEESDKLPKYRPVFMTQNAISLAGRVQLVTRFYGEPDQIHENYDYVHCTNYYTAWDNRLTLRPEALEALLAKDLRYVGSRYPLCSLVRTRKFIQRGWKISAGQYLKIATNLQKFDLTNVAVLEDQLTGVDTAFFNQLITALKARDSNTVDTAYLVELIDQLF